MEMQQCLSYSYYIFFFLETFDCNSVSLTDQLNTQQLIGMSLSEPHASRTALFTHVSVCLD